MNQDGNVETEMQTMHIKIHREACISSCMIRCFLGENVKADIEVSRFVIC